MFVPIPMDTTFQRVTDRDRCPYELLPFSDHIYQVHTYMSLLIQMMISPHLEIFPRTEFRITNEIRELIRDIHLELFINTSISKGEIKV